jgi:peptidoglycan/xylan/chitin deacetylase (PgdA/CDA1 family)
MRLKELTIIQYQNVSKNPDVYRLWLSTNSFQKQIEYLTGNNFQLLAMDDAILYMKRKKSVENGRPIAITFDNGYQEFYENVFPILIQKQYPATILISPSKVGTSTTMGTTKVDYLSWGTLKELRRNGIIIGAYEDAAWNINDIPGDVVRAHIVEYKKILEDRLGEQIHYFGVKEGVPEPAIRDLLVSEGYDAFLTECPTHRKPDLYAIGRIQVDDDDFNIFLTKVSRTYLFFKDKKSWKYIREYSLDKLAHKISETYDKITSLRSLIL